MRMIVVRCTWCHTELVIARSAGRPVSATALAAAMSGDTLPGVSVSEVEGVCVACLDDRSNVSSESSDPAEGDDSEDVTDDRVGGR